MNLCITSSTNDGVQGFNQSGLRGSILNTSDHRKWLVWWHDTRTKAPHEQHEQAGFASRQEAICFLALKLAGY